MADNDYLHTTEILKAAMPYVDLRTKPAIDLCISTYEFMACISNIRTNNLAACGFNNQKLDLEALLTGIRPKCNDNEKAFVDSILGFFNAKKMYEMYNTYMTAMKAMQNQDFSDFGFDESSDSTSVMKNLSEVFSKNSDLFNDFNKDTSMYNDNEESSSNNENTSHDLNSEDISNDLDENENSTYDDNNKNNSMFNMLKALVPPEQQSTFKNLRMLFDTMSYDDNNEVNNNEADNNEE